MLSKLYETGQYAKCDAFSGYFFVNSRFLDIWSAGLEYERSTLGVRRSKVNVTRGQRYIWKPGRDSSLDPIPRDEQIEAYSERRKCCEWKGEAGCCTLFICPSACSRYVSGWRICCSQVRSLLVLSTASRCSMHTTNRVCVCVCVYVYVTNKKVLPETGLVVWTTSVCSGNGQFPLGELVRN